MYLLWPVTLLLWPAVPQPKHSSSTSPRTLVLTAVTPVQAGYDNGTDGGTSATSPLSQTIIMVIVMRKGGRQVAPLPFLLLTYQPLWPSLHPYGTHDPMTHFPSTCHFRAVVGQYWLPICCTMGALFTPLCTWKKYLSRFTDYRLQR